MATFRNVPGSGYGNPYVDSLIWGGKAWDVSPENPILVYLAQGDDYKATGTLHPAPPEDWLTDPTYITSWRDYYISAFSDAIDLYSSVANVHFAQVDDIHSADIVWWWYGGMGNVAGWHESPDESDSYTQRWGIFNSFTQSEFQFGGRGLANIIHEVGIGLGLAQPHNGGVLDDASRFPGVNGPSDLGDFGLNQTIYTQMSYNDGFNAAPADAEDGMYGYQGGLGAFDIAALQALYGANMDTATGDNVYTLPIANARGTGWSAIWDAGGNDTISAVGSRAGVTIDLRAATLQANDPHAGGYISEQNGVSGGFTIAKGVVIENATGSSYDDILIGNSATNVLNGGAGNDIYYVDSPSDVVIDSGGVDTVYATFDFSNPAIENVYVNGVLKTGTAPVVNGFQILKGGTKSDVLVGRAGSDKIYGGLGKDVMTGGAGKDIFVFNTKPSKANMDKITDFNVKDDTIWLDNNYMTKLGKGTEPKPGKLNKAFFTIGPKAKDKNDYLVYDNKKGVLYYDADGSGAGKAVEITTLKKGLKMTYLDFMVI
ncbi:M10 family metallopeptidase C-terminal domain-containing protein [Microvirga puerhi]|uniref:M10 family metallopeptidase C-terminal domain-containing protein n=1 Tax=Microvirga puerhi TaxID=2876078 RepID=A0ABS7VT87_9HYPH|nr:M10 family metallopeptidase C-terminal domain-containing protein [Microvirga puerhi]MBZ6078782.1 M10 family metallopeptidase C-terminal domain-containing protein [Microvirga puerhi]